MRSRTPLLPLLSGLAFVVACGGNTAASDSIDDAQGRWNAKHLADYSFRLRTGGASPSVTTAIVVHADEAASQIEEASSSPSASSYPLAILPAALTMDRVFFMARDLARPGDAVTATFDAEYGFPTSFTASSGGEGDTLQVVDFHVLAPSGLCPTGGTTFASLPTSSCKLEDGPCSYDVGSCGGAVTHHYVCDCNDAQWRCASDGSEDACPQPSF